MPKIERKFVPLSQLKMSDEAPGTIEGYRAVFGEIDRQGDVVVKGAFSKAHDEYMLSGFSAHSHIWDFKDSVGYPVDAYEDDYGWFVKSEFHSTQGAQDVRTIAKERVKAGKQVGFSFGYSADDFQYIEQKDFKTELPLFIKADRLEANMKLAQKFSRIRILKRVSVAEDSLVTRAANPLARATSIKSDESDESQDVPQNKGMLDDAIEEREESVYFLSEMLQTAIWRAQMLAEADPNFNLTEAINGITADLNARLIVALVGPEEDSGGAEMASLREPLSFKGDLRAGSTFAKTTETVLAAVEVFAQRGVAISEFVNEFKDRSAAIMETRFKDGRMYSSTNLSQMKRVHESMGKLRKDVKTIHSDMADLIQRAQKPEKSETESLRTQSLKAQSMALMALNN